MLRSPKLALGAGFVLVLAMYGILALALRGGAANPIVPTAAPISEALPAEAPSLTASPTAVAARAPRPGAAAQGMRASGGASPRLELSAPTVGLGREIKRDADGNIVPIFSGTELRDQIRMTDAAMAACVQQSTQRATGKATIAFTVAARAGKLVIESTSVEDADSLVGYPELLDCMHRTSNAFAPLLEGRPIPELGTPIYVRRHVRLDGGALVENSYFNFSYNP